ncbi:hypothetical protein GGR52DRAFT_572382 [Hypoxylon sp. FL1284]|nr:hypothetical protein GGR52DRAFT_572382 [Hypoxylon sp. FL1284]
MRDPGLLAAGGLALLTGAAFAGKVRLIIDTDMLNFNDDPMAIGEANILQNWGEVELIGVLSCINSRYAPPGIDAINTYFGHPDIPVAVQKPIDNLTAWPDRPEFGDYLTGLTYNFTEDIRDGTYTPDPVSTYRFLLSTSANNSVTIAAIGFYNNLFHLMNSGADDISPLTGAELLASKVRELVVQANEEGASYNTGTFDPGFAQAVLNWWPGRVTFAADEVAENTVIGRRITTAADAGANPLAYALRASIGYGAAHPVWDAVAVYYAVCGLDDVFRWKYPRGGRATLDPAALAAWRSAAPDEPPGPQNALRFALPNTTFAARLENALLWEPGQPVPRARTWCRH